MTVSDRCSRGEAEDTSGQALAEFFSDKAAFKVTQRFCVPDEKKEIIDALDRWVKMKVNLILTTGKEPRKPWRFKQSNRIFGGRSLLILPFNHVPKIVGSQATPLPMLETDKSKS